MKLSAQIANRDTGMPIPFASVIIVDKNGAPTGTGTAADVNGLFTLDALDVRYPNYLLITSVGYQSLLSELDYTDNIGLTFYLPVSIKMEQEVIVTGNRPSSKAMLIILAVIGFIILLKKKNNTVGKVTPQTAITIGAFLLLIVGWKIITKLLQVLGIMKSPEEQQVDNIITDPTSYWDSSFWKKQPSNQSLWDDNTVNGGIFLLDMSFSPFNDDEEQVISFFKAMRSKAQASYFADKFKQKKGQDLVVWITQGAWPNDRLSSAEFAQIDNYIKKLPNYVTN